MRPFFLSAACLVLTAAPAWSILIETGPKTRVGGYWVSENAKQVTVRFRLPGGKEKVETFSRSKIKIIHQVDRKRLGMLTRDHPAAYQNYAEELARQKSDPEAIEVASRLFLIGAYLDPAKLGRSGLLRMSALADRPADARRYRAMAFVLDAAGDNALLKADAAAKKAPGKELPYFQKALRQYRNGQFSEAQSNAIVAGVEACFRDAPGMLSQKDFVQACKDAMVKRSLTEDNIEAVIRAEVWALDQALPAGPTGKRGPASGWARALSSGDTAAIPALTLETVAPYDPRRCVFRDGDWVVP